MKNFCAVVLVAGALCASAEELADEKFLAQTQPEIHHGENEIIYDEPELETDERILKKKARAYYAPSKKYPVMPMHSKKMPPMHFGGKKGGRYLQEVNEEELKEEELKEEDNNDVEGKGESERILKKKKAYYQPSKKMPTPCAPKMHHSKFTPSFSKKGGGFGGFGGYSHGGHGGFGFRHLQIDNNNNESIELTPELAQLISDASWSSNQDLKDAAQKLQGSIELTPELAQRVSEASYNRRLQETTETTTETPEEAETDEETRRLQETTETPEEGETEETETPEAENEGIETDNLGEDAAERNLKKKSGGCSYGCHSKKSHIPAPPKSHHIPKPQIAVVQHVPPPVERSYTRSIPLPSSSKTYVYRPRPSTPSKK